MTPTVSLPGETVWIPSCLGVQSAVLASEDEPQAARPRPRAIAVAERMPAPLRRWMFMVSPGVLGVVLNWEGWNGQAWRAIRFSKNTVIHVAGTEMTA